MLQHRISDQEDVLQQLQHELEQVDADRAAEYESTLANISQLEEALALAQDHVAAGHKVEVLEEQKRELQNKMKVGNQPTAGKGGTIRCVPSHHIITYEMGGMSGTAVPALTVPVQPNL